MSMTLFGPNFFSLLEGEQPQEVSPSHRTKTTGGRAVRVATTSSPIYYSCKYKRVIGIVRSSHLLDSFEYGGLLNVATKPST